ncbi:MAG: ABC transporter substrate-binding protein [Gloeotrichia echinulata CP02]|jgi:branched-chain amino acid transport system substrate-binding protein|nr:ABC transporter substrate-binding protein [Gloeotrichia echinulata DEX184]
MLPTFKKPDRLTLFKVGSLTFYGLLLLCLPNINNLSPRKASRLCPNNQTSPNTESSGQSNGISFGETSFIQPEGNPSSERKDGIYFIKNKNDQYAKKKLETAINNNPNDPEALIFLNNINIRLNNANSYTIAVTVPKNQQIALEILRGVAQAQDEINKSPDGMNGKKLKVAIADDSDKNKPKEIASALVNKEEVLGVVGHFTSDATKEAGSVYCNKKLVAISPTSTSVKLENQINPYIFTTVPSDAVQARALAEYMVRTLKKKKAVVFYNSDSHYSLLLKSQLETAISLEGGQVLNKQENQQAFDVKSMPGTPRTSLDKATELGAEVLILALDTDSFEKAADLAQQQPEFTLLGGDALYRKNTLEWKQAPNEIVVAAPWHKELSDKTLTFSDNAQKLWGTPDVNWRTALAYDATQAFIEALKKNQNPNPTREDIKKALSDKDFSSPNGASGPIRFLPSGERNAPFQLVKVFPNKNGEDNFCPIQKLKQPDKCDT